MSSTEIISQNPPATLKSQSVTSDISDNIEMSEPNQAQAQEFLKRTQPKTPECTDQTTPTRVSVQSEGENDKENNIQPQTSSNSSQAKLNTTIPPPEDLLRRLQEKANSQFSHDKKIELNSNATNQINNIMNILGVSDKSVRNLTEVMNQPLSNPLLGGNPSDNMGMMNLNNYLALQLPNLINNGSYSLTNLGEKSIQSIYNPNQEKNGFYKDQRETLQMAYQIQSQLAQNQATNQDNSQNEQSDEEEARRGFDSAEKNDNSKNPVSGQSSESKFSNSKDGQISMIDESLQDNMKFSKDVLQKRKRTRQCLNKLCLTDPNDPNLWSKQKVKNSAICKYCFDAWKKQQYCVFCYQIYLDQEGTASNDDKDWIGCDQCGRWNHIDCEQEQGLKTIKLQVEKDKSFKYFCPSCRSNDKSSVVKPAPKRGKGPGRLPKTAIYQKQQLSYRRVSSVKSDVTQKVTLEEKGVAIIDDNIEDVINKKVKIASEVVEHHIDSPTSVTKEGIVPVIKQQNNPDIAKKKLDSMLSRANGSKKRFVVRAVTTSYENYSDIDKLMNQYSGKKIQLSENEIREDLSLFRELCKGGLYYDSDRYRRDDDYNNYDDESEGEDPYDDGKPNGRGRGRGNMRFRKSRKGKGKNFYAETDLFYLDGEDSSESNEGQVAATGNRKKNKSRSD